MVIYTILGKNRKFVRLILTEKELSWLYLFFLMGQKINGNILKIKRKSRIYKD